MNKKIIKRIGLVLLSLIAIIATAGLVLWGIGSAKLNKKYEQPVAQLEIPSDSASIARGQYLATANLCFDCHGKDLSGTMMMEDPVFGILAAPNLTSGEGGIGKDYQTSDWIRAIRHGLNRDNQSLWLMPSEIFAEINDQDLAAIVSYMQQIPAVDKQQVSRKNGPIMTLISSFSNGLLAAEKMPAQQEHSKKVEIKPAVSVEYGSYLANTCRGCHGPDLKGGLVHGPPGTPPTANISTHKQDGIGNWSEGDFFNALRTGKRPDGSEINEAMPRALGQMTDDDLKAVWLYLQTVKPVADETE